MLISLLIKTIWDKVQGNTDKDYNKAKQHCLNLDKLILQVEEEHIFPVSCLVKGKFLDVTIKKKQEEERPIVELSQPKWDWVVEQEMKEDFEEEKASDCDR